MRTAPYDLYGTSIFSALGFNTVVSDRTGFAESSGLFSWFVSLLSVSGSMKENFVHSFNIVLGIRSILTHGNGNKRSVITMLVTSAQKEREITRNNVSIVQPRLLSQPREPIL